MEPWVYGELVVLALAELGIDLPGHTAKKSGHPNPTKRPDPNKRVAPAHDHWAGA